MESGLSAGVMKPSSWWEIISGLSLHNVGVAKVLDTFIEGELYGTKKRRITDNS